MLKTIEIEEKNVKRKNIVGLINHSILDIKKIGTCTIGSVSIVPDVTFTFIWAHSISTCCILMTNWCSVAFIDILKELKTCFFKYAMSSIDNLFISHHILSCCFVLGILNKDINVSQGLFFRISSLWNGFLIHFYFKESHICESCSNYKRCKLIEQFKERENFFYFFTKCFGRHLIKSLITKVSSHN